MKNGDILRIFLHITLSIIIIHLGSKPLLYYNKHIDTSKLRARDVSPPVTLTAGPVYVGEGAVLGFELDDDIVAELLIVAAVPAREVPAGAEPAGAEPPGAAPDD